MAQSDARFGYRANLSRTDHDLSRTFGFTCPPGMELPVFYDLATPSDTYYITHDLEFLRTAPLAAPAMVDCKVHFETFFVPMQMIYEPFENVIFQLKNMRSSLYDNTQLQNINFPLFNYSQFINHLKADYSGTGLLFDAFRLADHFGLNPTNFAYQSGTPKIQDFAPNFFPWMILAYHTIYEYYYRLDDKTQFKNHFCNWDKYYNVNTPVEATYDFFEIHRRPWDFDFYTSVYSSPIVSSANMQEILYNGRYNWLMDDEFGTAKTGADGANVSNNADMHGVSSMIPFSSLSKQGVQGAFSTSAIRQMFANEKLAMITGRTRKTYDSQVLAHFGINVPHDVKHDLSLIGRSSFDLVVGEVTSLASTTESPLGELAGKGWSKGQGKQFKFEAPCHGVIMTLFCIEPKQRYYGGFDRLNITINAFDVPQPEFDRLGNCPMCRFELGRNDAHTSGMTQNDIIGWKERYYEYKRRADKTTWAFCHSGERGHGYGNSYASYMISNVPLSTGEGIGGDITPRPDLYGAYYINYHALDELMLVPYFNGWKQVSEGENWNITPWLAYSRDPFIVDSSIKVKKVSWLSKDGEPVYNF